MSIDQTQALACSARRRSAADVLVQEYGRYFGMKTGCFRGGCLTGPAHSGTELHGFLAYLMKCAVTGTPYTRLRLQGQAGARQHPQRTIWSTRSGISSRAPRAGEVYNIGGGRHSQLLDARGHRARARRSPAGRCDWTYVDENAHRRPHLVDQRRPPVPDALSRTWRHATICATLEDIHAMRYVNPRRSRLSRPRVEDAWATAGIPGCSRS